MVETLIDEGRVYNENRSYPCVGPGFTNTKLGQTTGPDRLAIKDFIVVTSACPRQGAGGGGPPGCCKKGLLRHHC